MLTGGRKMTTGDAAGNEPLWLAMERKIQELGSSELGADNKESAIQRIAKNLDGSGHNVSRHGGNMLQLRWAIEARLEVGKPLLEDFNAAIAALTLEDVADTGSATIALVREVGEAWPKLKDIDRRPGVQHIVEKSKLDLLVAKAKELPDETGVRYLIEEAVSSEDIIGELEISAEKLAEVNALIEAERAAVARVEQLLEAVEGQSNEDKAKHLIVNDVADELIVEIAGIEKSVIEGVKDAMAAELEEKHRLEEEAAAQKKAAAEGPALDDIPADQMLEHIEAIREIMEFSDQADEIRQMCEQSNIPKGLVDIAVSDPDKLDELEKAAEG